MYVIIFRHRILTGPGEQWKLVPEGLYFDRKAALADCKLFNGNGTAFVYAVNRLVPVL